MRTRWLGLTAAILAGCEPAPPAILAAPPAVPVAAQPPQLTPLRRGVFTPARHAGSALGLTASDGTGLRLVGLAARSVITDPLAFTELRLVFDNPQDRALEGTFRITLPQGASVSRFAMRIDSRWQEGEVVETQAARRAYEDFLHRKQDPALLEKSAGNEFSARVFPIPARGRKELILSYSQELTRSSEPFRLPLGGLPQVDQIEAEVYGDGGGKLLGAFRQERFQPQGDFAVELLPEDRGPGLRSGELLVTRVTPVAEARPDPLGPALLLVDTSASRALGFEAQIRLVEDLTRRLAQSSGAATPVAVVAFDQTLETIYEGPASGYGPASTERLRARGALGASDLAEALRSAGEKAKNQNLRRVLLVTDGVATAGPAEGAALKEQAGALRAAGVERLDVVAVGGIRDDDLLRRVATAGLPRDGVVADASQDQDALWRRLSSLTRSNLPVRVEGARWWYPKKLDGVQPGDETLIYAEIPAQSPVSVTVGDRTLTPALASTERPLLERSWASAKIGSLLDQDRADAAETRRQVIELSTRHRVLSPFTSLLVLETEEDYARFKIDRSALVDILTIQQGQLSVAGRTTTPPTLFRATDEVPPEKAADLDPSAPAPGDEADRPRPARPATAPAAQATGTAPATAPPPPPPPSPPSVRPEAVADKADAKPEPSKEEPGEAIGAGGLGLSGVGTGAGGLGDGIGLGNAGTIGHGSGTASGQGFGSGHGRLGGSHRTAAPQLRQGATSVSGRLPPEVIQRIVRQNFGRFRLCYENGLRNNPNLQGRVSVRFIINRDGAVSGQRNSGSDLPDAGVVACVIRSFSGLQFPQPEGGIVTVTYPIHFAPGDSSAPPGRTPRDAPPGRAPREAPEPERPAAATPYTGRFKTVMERLGPDPKAALSEALTWHSQQPADILALVALGEAHERLGATASAARAYGSLIDLFPARADLRRYAASRIERLEKSALPLAIDTLKKAREQRPDHPASHRMLAMALLRQGDHEQAFQVTAEGLKRSYPEGRFAGHDRIFREDLGLIAAAWKKAEPKRADEINKKLKEAGGSAESAPSLRFVLTWETDANDVDFHIYDSKGGHAFYGRPSLPGGGGELYADVTTGYGPECFTIRKPAAQRPDYTLQAHYYSRGPMGYGMGKLEVIDHDGHGNLSFEERPFVVMADQAYINLGEVKKK